MNKLRCPSCKNSSLFDCREDVLDHAVKKHNLKVDWCDKCQASFQKIEDHVSSVHARHPHQCPFCVHFSATVGERAQHLEALHRGRIGRHEQADGFKLDRTTLPPTEEALKEVMEEEGCPPGLDFDTSEKFFLVAQDEEKRPIVTFVMLTPAMVSIKTVKRRGTPNWWASIPTLEGHDKSHLVTSSEIRHAPVPNEDALKVTNYVYMTSSLNQIVMNSLEHHFQTLGKCWDRVLIYTVVKYKSDDRVVSLVGKVALCQREGEDHLLLSFVMENRKYDNGDSFWNFITSLEEFCATFHMSFFDVHSDCRQLYNIKSEIFLCDLRGCPKTFLCKEDQEAHYTAHVARVKKPGLRLRQPAKVRNNLVCFLCIVTCTTPFIYKEHLSVHAQADAKRKEELSGGKKDASTQWEDNPDPDASVVKVDYDLYGDVKYFTQ